MMDKFNSNSSKVCQISFLVYSSLLSEALGHWNFKNIDVEIY